MAKLLTDELALVLAEELLKNDKVIRDDLQAKIDNISTSTGTSPTVTMERTAEDDGVIITVTDINGTSSIIVRDGARGEKGENGKNAKVAKIEPIVGGSRITFSYYDDTNVEQTSNVEIMNGSDGAFVTSARIEDGNELILILSNGDEISAGAISISSEDLNLDGYYTSVQIDELLANQQTVIYEYIDTTVDTKVTIKFDETVDTASEEDINSLF